MKIVDAPTPSGSPGYRFSRSFGSQPGRACFPAPCGILTEMLSRTGAGGNLTNDAHLAALATEHRAGIVSYDPDFARFGIGWDRPDDLL